MKAEEWARFTAKEIAGNLPFRNGRQTLRDEYVDENRPMLEPYLAYWLGEAIKIGQASPVEGGVNGKSR